MIKECIILAGGLGTRLRSEVADLPKCMAPVAEKPFLHWVIANLLSQKVTSFVLSLGYMHEKIEVYINEVYPTLDVKFSVENEPLGTGGAIKLALNNCTQENVLVLNGDTLFEINNASLYEQHISSNAACTLSLKPMVNFDRYGCVTINGLKQVIAFEEKKHMETGLINGGVYLINKSTFSSLDFPDKFSFEKDFLEKYVTSLKMMAVVNDGYFIDIGIPEDFKKANEEIKNKYNDSFSGDK
jgi:D-glycero-alpha-D-manno-heptose 1-phosphate guanylyltransferase